MKITKSHPIVANIKTIMENFLFEEYNKDTIKEFKQMAKTYLDGVSNKYKIADNKVKTKFLKSSNTMLVDIHFQHNKRQKILHFAMLPGSPPR